MAFNRPDLSTIITRVQGDLKSALGITAILRRSFEDAIAKAIAGVSHILHGHMRFISKQIFPDQAEFIYLERWAAIYSILRKAATQANLTIAGTGTNGSVIPIGTSFQRSDNEIYLTDSEVTIAAGVFSVNITSSNSGIDLNMIDSTTVSLTSPIAGVDTDSLVTATVIEAENLETDASLRTRVLDRIRFPPSGGTATDYISYAKSVSGVTRAWVFPLWLGAGTVGISFVEDDEDPILPDPAKITEVETAINAKKPVTATITVFAPTEVTLDITVAIKPDTTAIRASITTEIEDMLLREAQVSGAYKDAVSTYDGKITISKLNEAISIADDEEDHAMTIPAADISPASGSMVILGTITFSTLA